MRFQGRLRKVSGISLTADPTWRGYYTKVARPSPATRVYELISETKQASLDGWITTTKAKYFTDLTQRYLGRKPYRGEEADTAVGERGAGASEP